MQQSEELITLKEASKTYNIPISRWMAAISRKLLSCKEKRNGNTPVYFLKKKDIDDFLEKYPKASLENLVSSEEKQNKINSQINESDRISKKVRDILYEKRLESLDQDPW